MPFFDALKVTLARNHERETHIFLSPANQEVVIRLGTSDLKCLEHVFIGNQYELPFALSPRLIVDAGANTGMATLYFAAQFPEARIFAIEPERSNFEILERNCEHLPNVTLVHAALWPDRGTLSISNISAEKWAFIVTDQIARGSSATQVPGITIRDILDQTGAKCIDLLKLDIEGSELELFSKNTDHWLDQIQIIAIELHDRFRPGCAHALYSALAPRKFEQEINGENIFIRIVAPPDRSTER